MKTTKFVLSSDPAKLLLALEGQQGARSATVEAEYGDTLVKGTVITMAHHGLRAGQPAPCSYPNGCTENIDIVGLSHLDLDSLGGCAAILDIKHEAPGFWELAEFVDLKGAHKLGESGASEENLRRLHAFWAWNEANKTFPPRDGSVLDVTDKVFEAITVVTRVINNDEGLLKLGDEFKAAGEELNRASFVEVKDGVIVRVASGFTNHLYVTPGGIIAQAVVAFNTLHGSITVSFADKPKGKTAKDIVQTLFGSEAGGHAGIAGSPRGKRMAVADLIKAFEATIKALAE